jgi:tetratricopeptide (TPR) repeat protein
VWAALEWAIARGDVGLLEQMRGGLSTWYALTGRYRDWETGAGRAAARFRAALAAGGGKAAPHLRTALGVVLGHEASAVALQGQYDRAHRLLDEANSLAGETGDVQLQAEHASVRALLLHRRGDLPAARQQLEEALALARAARAPRLEAAALWRLGACALDAGDDPGARAYLERALALYRVLDDHLGEATVRAYQGALARERGDIAAAQRLFDDTVHVFRAFRHRALEWFALHQLGRVCDEGMGQHTAAEGYITQALRLAWELGDRQSEAVTRAYQGRNALYQGDLVRAQTAFEEALAICREIGSQVGVGLAERGLGLLAHYRGDEREACAWARQALAVARETGQRRLERGALRLLGHAWAGLGELTSAAVAYQQARELDRVLGTPHLACETTVDLARVALAQGDLNQAAADAATIMDALRDADLAGAVEPVAVYLTCYHVLRAGRSPRAEDALARGYTLLRERAAQFAADDQRRSFLENIPAHRDLLRAWSAHGQGCAAASVLAV